MTMTTTKRTTIGRAREAVRLYEALDAHIRWVERHEGNVDYDVFREESARLAAAARRLAGLREWAGGEVEGLCALDFTAAVLGVTIPGLAFYFPDLPGAKEYLAHCRCDE